MKQFLLILIVSTLFITTTFQIMAQKDNFNPPPTKKISNAYQMHGFRINDPYLWLEDKTNPDVREWSESQHNFTVDYLKNHTSTISGLESEIDAYLNRDIISAPFFVKDREFFYSRKKGQQQSKLFTRIKGKEHLIFDPEIYDESGKAAISSTEFTLNGDKVAIGIQFSGNEVNDFYIIDSKSGKVLNEPIKGLRGFSWTKDEKNAYLSVQTEEMINKQQPVHIYLHKIGTDRKDDLFIMAPDDAKKISGVWDSEFENITFYSTGDFYSGEIKMKMIGSNEEPRILYNSNKFKASPFAKNGKIYYFTNDNAPNFKILTSDIESPEFNNARVLYPEQETVLENYALTTDFFIIQDKKEVISRLRAFDLNGKFIKEIELPEFGDVRSISYNDHLNALFVSLATFTNPGKIYKLDGKTLKWEFVYQDVTPVDTKEIESKMVFYKSTDGTKVPLFLVYKKGIQKNSSNPTLLYGYGGFNISMGPSFVGTAASFINRGGIYAIACIRGGSEFGENWHLDGMLLKKQNTFDDFISAAEFLINENYTNPSKLSIKGGSNGGLLVGAVSMQRPDLFNSVVCSVPLLDMLRYHKFLIARYWIPEYGDPDIESDFLNILKYSPYQNIKPLFNYPSMLVKAGENDTRVDPLHAKKFAAALQNNYGQENPIMLYIDFESGHGSGKSVSQQIEDIYLEWRFIMNNLGMN